MEGYQVSNQCQSVVRDKCLIPTKDAPELAYIRESTSEQYIPDVYFKVSAHNLAHAYLVCISTSYSIYFSFLPTLATANVPNTSVFVCVGLLN